MSHDLEGSRRCRHEHTTQEVLTRAIPGNTTDLQLSAAEGVAPLELLVQELLAPLCQTERAESARVRAVVGGQEHLRALLGVLIDAPPILEMEISKQSTFRRRLAVYRTCGIVLPSRLWFVCSSTMHTQARQQLPNLTVFLLI